tara:strand:+ start:4291 stop:4722 length:432 start_codon:yes stop_codon:yes gene_type:complete
MGGRTHFSCEQNLLKLSEPEQAKARAKMKQLSMSLDIHEYKYGIRDDSKLAFNYCTGDLNWTEVDVMEELCLIQWLSENTDYHNVCETLIREVAAHCKAKYKIRDWSLLYRIVRSYVPDILKQHLVSESGLPELRKVRWGDDY